MTEAMTGGRPLPVAVLLLAFKVMRRNARFALCVRPAAGHGLPHFVPVQR